MFDYDVNGAGTTFEATNRLFLRTDSGFALKLESGLATSIEAKVGKVHIKGVDGVSIMGHTFTDMAGKLYIDGVEIGMGGGVAKFA